MRFYFSFSCACVTSVTAKDFPFGLAGDRGIRRGSGLAKEVAFTALMGVEDGRESGVFAYRVGSGRGFGEGASG